MTTTRVKSLMMVWKFALTRKHKKPAKTNDKEGKGIIL